MRKALWALLVSVLMISVMLTVGCGRTSPFQKGQEAFRKKNFDAAITCYTEAISRDPKDGGTYYARGRAYEGKGEQDKAQADFAEAKKLGFSAD
jgi:Flp pilus assembly protein TadD